MKIALYIEEGLEQIVLTPETKAEDRILDAMHQRKSDVEILKGSFYECRGGWVRQSSDQASTMLVLRPAPPKVEMHSDDITMVDRFSVRGGPTWISDENGYTNGD